MSGRFESYINSHFNVVSSSGSEIVCICPWHDDHSGHLYINEDTGLFICFSCGKKGALARDPDVAKQTPYTLEMMAKMVEKLNSPPQKTKFYQESWLSQFDTDLSYWTSNRNLPDDVVRLFNLGYDPFTNRATIPLRDVQGRILGVTYRRLDGGMPKYLHPKGFPTGRHLFGAHLLNGERTIAITEGQVDAIRGRASRVPTVATMGARLTRDQIKLLQRLGIRKVVILYDNDKAGRKGVLNAYSGLQDTGIAVSVGWYRPYWASRDAQGVLRPLKDPDSLNEHRYRKMYHSAIPFISWWDKVWVPHALLEAESEDQR